MMPALRFDPETSRRMEILYTGPDAKRRRSEALRMLALRPGERVLDVGCGPGFLTAEIAAEVGASGLVRAVDNSDAMVGLARARCEKLPAVEIAPGDATRLDFPADAFDAAVSVQVHEYVKDVGAGLRELHRVLRPGGRLLLVATDWDSIVWASSDRERMARVLDAFEEHLADPHLPTRLAPLFREAGFETPRCEVVVQLNCELEEKSYSAGLLDLIHRFVPGRRGVSQREADAWAEELRLRGQRGEHFFSLNQYFFLAARS
jgi:ubiquinone/menaquinone biosynthesis C-methylase UbiE